MKLTIYPLLNSFSKDGYTTNLRLIVNVFLHGEDISHEIEEFTNEDTGEYIDIDTLNEEQMKDMKKFFDRLYDEHYDDLRIDAAECAQQRIDNYWEDR